MNLFPSLMWKTLHSGGIMGHYQSSVVTTTRDKTRMMVL